MFQFIRFCSNQDLESIIIFINYFLMFSFCNAFFHQRTLNILFDTLFDTSRQFWLFDTKKNLMFFSNSKTKSVWPLQTKTVKNHFVFSFIFHVPRYRRTNVKYKGNNRQKSLIINKKTPVCTHVAITNTSAEKRKRDKAESRKKCYCSNNFSTSPAASSVCHFAWVRQLLLHSFRFINWTVSLIICENLFTLIRGRQLSSGNSMGKVKNWFFFCVSLTLPALRDVHRWNFITV